MAKLYDRIDDKLARRMLAQPVFFVGTAPLSADGHVNVSPKGMAGTFAVLGPHRVAYLDYTGSGAETIAHLRENGRIVVMFCAFTGRPDIIRLHGRGRTTRPGDDEYATLRSAFPKEQEHGARSVIVVDVERISDSCGYSVPRMDYVEDRDVLDLHLAHKSDDYLDDYVRNRNAESIDGLPALDPRA